MRGSLQHAIVKSYPGHHTSADFSPCLDADGRAGLPRPRKTAPPADNHPGARRATPPHLRRGAFSTTPLLIQEGWRLGRRGGCTPGRVFPQPVQPRRKHANAVIPSPFAVILSAAKNLALPLRVNYAKDLALSIFKAMRDSSFARLRTAAAPQNDSACEFFRSLFSWDFSPGLDDAWKGGPSAPPKSRLPPSIPPAPRAVCGCKLRGVRDLEIIRTALQRRG